MKFKDYYQIMGVERSADQDEIKRAYRKLARKFHPDVSKEAQAETRFKELGEAYDVLGDPEKRTAYDQLGANWRAGKDFEASSNWDQEFESHQRDTGSGDYSDFFEQQFARGARTQHQFHAQGNDTYAKVVIDLEDAYRGATRTLTLKQTELGPDDHPFLTERTLSVAIPIGVRQGQYIRLAGQGGPGLGKGVRGDLYLEVQYRQHKNFHASGRDVTVELPVTPWEAVLGTKVKCPTPSGLVELTIPAGSNGGSKMRLKGRGIPGKKPGDLFAVLRIVMPVAETESAKSAWRDLAKAVPFDPRADLEA